MSLCYELGLTCLVDSIDMCGLLFNMSVKMIFSLLFTFTSVNLESLDLCIYCVRWVSHAVLGCECRLNCHRVSVNLFDLICHTFLICMLNWNCHAFLISLNYLYAAPIFRRWLYLTEWVVDTLITFLLELNAKSDIRKTRRTRPCNIWFKNLSTFEALHAFIQQFPFSTEDWSSIFNFLINKAHAHVVTSFIALQSLKVVRISLSHLVIL